MLIMGEGAEVQGNSVVQAIVRYKLGKEVHQFVVVEMAKKTVILGNDFGCKAGFLIDQQSPRVFLKRQLGATGLATPQLPSLGWGMVHLYRQCPRLGW